MWKLKLQKVILLNLLLLFCCVWVVSASEDLSDLEEFQELASNLSQESYWNEIEQVKYWTDSVLLNLQSSQLMIMDDSLLRELNSCSDLMKSEEFVSMKLSDQLRVLSSSQKTSTQLIQKYLELQNTHSDWLYSNLKSMSELLSHFEKLQTILLKIIKSQNEDTKLAIEQLSSAINDVETLRTNLEVCEKLAIYQAEEINALSKKYKALKHVRTASLIIFGAGIVGGFLGFGLENFDVPHDITQALIVGGSTMIMGGAITFCASFTIPL